MKTALMLLCLLQTGLVQAQGTAFVSVCDRTQQVQDAIVDAVEEVDACALVTAEHLAGISGDMLLTNKGITTLKTGDFQGLTLMFLALNNNALTTLPAGVFSGLTVSSGLDLSFNALKTLPIGVFSGSTITDSLGLNNNALTTLPAGVFSGLTISDLFLNSNQLITLPAGVFSGLTISGALFLNGNPGASFDLTVELEPADNPNEFRLKLAPGIPRALTIPITVSGGTASPAEASFTAGATTSDTFTVTRSGSSATTVSIGDLPALPGGYVGLELKKGDPLVLIVPVCDRTQQVRDEIVRQAPVDDCAMVTAEHLAGISGNISLSNKGITTLKAGDFQGLTLSHLYLFSNQLTTLPANVFNGLTISGELNLSNNQLTTLPAGMFDGLTITNLYLQANQLTTLPAGIFSGLTISGGLNLQSNPGTSFDLTVELEPADNPNEFRLKLALGIPRALTIPITVSGGTASPAEASLTAGATTSDTFTVTRSGSSATTVSIGELPALPGGYVGLELKKGDPLVLIVPVCDRTQQVQDEIVRQAPVDDCSLVTAVHVAGISGNMNLFNKGITTLKAGDFQGLTLSFLALNSNDLTTLQAGVFSGLTISGGLSSGLDLGSNDLTNLPADVFSGLTINGDLSLYGNDLTTLPAGIFSGLNLSGNLNLSRNDLTTLPAGIFSGLNLSGSLNLSRNDLTTLPAGIFSGLNLSGSLSLQRNPTTPFALTVELERGDRPGKINLKLAPGIPRDLMVPITVSAGTASPTEVSFAAGDTISEAFTVTRSGSGITIVRVGTLPDLPANYDGLQLNSGEPLVLFADAYLTGGGRSVADAKLLYYALLKLEDDEQRTAALNSVASEVSPEVRLAFVNAVHEVRMNDPAALDFNADGSLNAQDAAAFYYALALRDSLGDGSENSGFLAIREAILGPLMPGFLDPKRREILRWINGLPR